MDRPANIKSAATAIADVQTKNGALGAFAAIKECYETFVAPARAYSQQVETCLTQDVIHSRMTAAFYSSVSKEVLKQTGSPEPEAVMGAMAARVQQTFARLNVPVATAREILADIERVGEPAYLESSSPKQ